MDKIGQDKILLLMYVTKSYRSYTCSGKIWIVNVSSFHACMLVYIRQIVRWLYEEQTKMREEGVCRYVVFTPRACAEVK